MILDRHLELALSDYLHRVKSSHEGFSATLVRDEIQVIGRVLGKFCDFIKDASEYSEAEQPEDIDLLKTGVSSPADSSHFVVNE